MTFEEYVRAQRSNLLRFGTVLVGDGTLAEDLVQSVLARCYPRWDGIKGLDLPHAYVRRMLVNEYLSWRRKWHRTIATDNFDDLVPDSPDHADRHAERQALLELLARLPKQQRAAIVLRYYEDLSDREIAATLDCGESTVRSNIHRALVALRIHANTQTSNEIGTHLS